MRYADNNEALGWPAEMELKVVAHPETLLELLWIRHHAIGGACPELPPAELPGDAVRAEEDTFRASGWATHWHRAVARACGQPDLADSDTQSFVTEVAHQHCIEIRGPVDDWARGLVNNIGAEVALAPDVKKAWERGLRCVIDVPLRGEFAERIGDGTLLVSTATRSNPSAYWRALAKFSHA
ncbi:hypothetical protein ABCS02_00780 [Microbacterium sp. X-17]|uniref:hypothetical protein n=1 Tax=Microbacterium sp. X-17 TaxID=3144404 RepID=UPI0031F502F2